MTQLLKRFEPDGLAKEFDARQEFLNAGPVEINILSRARMSRLRPRNELEFGYHPVLGDQTGHT